MLFRSAKITTPFPSVLETAKRLGVSKRDAMVLSEMAERSQRTGVFAMSGEAIKIPSRMVVKFRVAKAAKDAIVPPKKK